MPNLAIEIDQALAVTILGPRPEYPPRVKAMALPTTPKQATCPKCKRTDAKRIRQHDEYSADRKRLTDMPESRLYIFACKCGCEFSVKVPYVSK